MPQPLSTVAIPPELTALDAQLAMDAVLSEMAVPGGLKLDEPIVDLVTQYKADLRVELSGHPQTLETQFAGKAVMDEAYVVPQPETAEPLPPQPEPDPPELIELQPATLSVSAADTPVLFIGGPFDVFCEIIWNGGVEVTQLIDENTLSTLVRPSTVAEPVTVEAWVRQGEHETAHLPFEFTADPPPPEGDVRERQERDAGPMAFAGRGPVERR